MSNKKTIKCPICGRDNLTENNFCQNCRYPVNVKKINELRKKEILVCFSSFLEVVSQGKKSLFDNKELERVYDELLSLNWLRPESALFSFIEAKILLAFKRQYLKYPLLDLGCGDGLFTTILFGARLNKAYDVYQAIDFNKRDIYDTYEKLPKDFFIKKPAPIGFGIDIKESMVKKARDLGVYDEVKQEDIRQLPFTSQSMASVFSNMIDDIKTDDLSRVFCETHRALKPNGYFVFTTPTERFRDFLFYYNKAQDFEKQGDKENYKLYSMLDRGRSDWQPRGNSLWTELFNKRGFQMIDCVEFLDKNMLRFWDTGFRPFFSYLFNLRETLKEKGMLLPIKKVYLEIIKHWLFEFTKGQIKPGKGGAFAVIVAQKI